MTLQELINKLEARKTEHGPDALVESDFGTITLLKDPEVVLVDVNNEGTLPEREV